MALIRTIYNLLLKLRFLFRPMFFLSLIFHLGFLSLPLPSPSKSEQEKTEEIEEKVEITRLIPPSPQPSPATPKPPPQVKSTPTPQPIQSLPRVRQQPRQIPTITQPSPTPQIIPSPQKSPTPKPTPTPTPSPISSPTPTPTPTPIPNNEVNNVDNQNEIASEKGSSLLEELRPRILKRLEESSNDLEAMENYIDTLPTQFIRDEHIAYFLTEEEQLKSGTLGFLTIPQTNPYGAYFDYIEPVVKNELGFEINPLEEEYGDSLLYQAKNSADVTFYMSIVKLKGSGALLVLWLDNPQNVP